MHKGNRKPVAAGRFYPKDRNVLAGLVWDLLQGCPRAEESQLQQTTGILVPHAGYPYSGTTAAAAFGYAQAAAPRRIWLVGPSHTLAFAGIALSGTAAFESPIGINPVSPVVSELAGLPGFMLLESAHSPEHSLEVELPFIQTVWGEVPIVPLLIGNENDWEDVSALAASLRDFLQPGDFWVASNDFTHYGSAFGYTPFPHHRAAEEIRKLDQRGAQLITTAHAQEFYQLAKTTTFDGATSIPLALLCQAPCKATLLMHVLSGDSTGNYDHSVSYLAMAFQRREKS